MSDSFDAIHSAVRQSALAQRFTLFVRSVLILGFVAPGLTKVLGVPFASGIPATHPMGAYFEAFHNIGGYYAFVGWAQVGAAMLLVSRRTALLGACLYTAIIGNIFVLVVATRFGVGTPVLTGLMTLACLWLLVWDAHRLRPLLSPAQSVLAQPAVEPPLWDLLVPASATSGVRWALRTSYILGLLAVLFITLSARGLPSFLLEAVLSTFALAVTGTLVAWSVHLVQRRRVRSATLEVG